MPMPAPAVSGARSEDSGDIQQHLSSITHKARTWSRHKLTLLGRCEVARLRLTLLRVRLPLLLGRRQQRCKRSCLLRTTWKRLPRCPDIVARSPVILSEWFVAKWRPAGLLYTGGADGGGVLALGSRPEGDCLVGLWSFKWFAPVFVAGCFGPAAFLVMSGHRKVSPLFGSAGSGC